MPNALSLSTILLDKTRFRISKCGTNSSKSISRHRASSWATNQISPVPGTPTLFQKSLQIGRWGTCERAEVKILWSFCKNWQKSEWPFWGSIRNHCSWNKKIGRVHRINSIETQGFKDNTRIGRWSSPRSPATNNHPENKGTLILKKYKML
jgi:hypothetical protein